MCNNVLISELFKDAPVKYWHTACGWKGAEEEMLADFSGEFWSNWICPQCKEWLQLSDYVRYKEMVATYNSIKPE